MSNHAKIIELRIRNVGPIEALDIKPNGAVTELRGKNASGKSTGLNAVTYLFEGGRAIPKGIVRNGAKSGEIVGVISEPGKKPMVFRRVLRKSGNHELTVTDGDGQFASSPQAVADALIGNRTVRAKAFCELPEREQHSVLAEVAGINLDEFTQAHQKAYNERTIVNRDVDRLTKAVAAIPVDSDVGTELRDVAALTKELAAAHALNAENTEKERNAQDARRTFSDIEFRMTELKEQLAELETKRDAAHQIMVDADDAAVDLVGTDPSYIQDQIAEADRYNGAVRDQLRRAELVDELRETKAHSENLSTGLDEIKCLEAKTIREAPMPIEGLAYTPDGVMFNSLPFSQASTAEQLAVSVAIGCKRSPKLRAMTFDDGQALDSAHREKLYKLVHDAGMFVLIAIVDDDGGGEVRIVEGVAEAVPE